VLGDGVHGAKSCSVTYLEAHAIGYRRSALPTSRNPRRGAF